MINAKEVLRKDTKKKYFLNPNFFYGFQFSTSTLKKYIKNYLIELENSTGFYVSSFSKLFKSYNLSYPVKVSGENGSLKLVTADEEIFELSFPLVPSIYGIFSIWKCMKDVTYVSYYSLAGNNKIILKEAKIFPVNSVTKSLEPYSIKITYNDDFTTIELLNFSSIIKVIYQVQSDEIDEKVVNCLLQVVTSNTYMYNVYNIFCDILSKKCDMENSSILSIGENNNIFSEIHVSEDSIVTQFSYTEFKDKNFTYYNTLHYTPNIGILEFLQC